MELFRNLLSNIWMLLQEKPPVIQKVVKIHGVCFSFFLLIAHEYFFQIRDNVFFKIRILFCVKLGEVYHTILMKTDNGGDDIRFWKKIFVGRKRKLGHAILHERPRVSFVENGKVA